MHQRGTAEKKERRCKFTGEFANEIILNVGWGSTELSPWYSVFLFLEHNAYIGVVSFSALSF